ncbi:Ribosomal silencing factor RsfS [Paraliobacillus sp. PM-2]|uniref:ribosome silencing factor n=1 Tax=Paraliobacillus sp. PM-2 TaxID=1462524 RepID=UPI00061BAAF8|nr:ribosome silencing factor [Paraliobacillus sp. PM-2]CQR46911.1 Ribosomal silencing factor RsfS [Paraliobacillus sp. PM-2]
MDHKEMVKIAAQACDDKRANDIITLDMSEVSLMADYFIICDGSNERQVQAIAREIKDQAEANDLEVKRLEGFEQARWILVDIGDVVCHVFHKDERSYYNLERLWGDAPLVDLELSKEG